MKTSQDINTTPKEPKTERGCSRKQLFRRFCGSSVRCNKQRSRHFQILIRPGIFTSWICSLYIVIYTSWCTVKIPCHSSWRRKTSISWHVKNNTANQKAGSRCRKIPCYVTGSTSPKIIRGNIERRPKLFFFFSVFFSTKLTKSIFLNKNITYSYKSKL